MFFGWFDTAEVDAFSASLVAEFLQRAPLDRAEARGGRSRSKEARTALLSRVEGFARTHRLNLFKRARLANTVKWGMQERGYDKEAADALALDIAKTAALTRYAGVPAARDGH